MQRRSAKDFQRRIISAIKNRHQFDSEPILLRLNCTSIQGKQGRFEVECLTVHIEDYTDSYLTH
ncbi:hypothetical protein D3C84_1183390 [compost metagenome]